MTDTTDESSTLTAANHLEISGHGIRGVLDVAGIDGLPLVSLEVDGRPVEGATLVETERGIVVEGVVDEVLDLRVTFVTLQVPRVNLHREPVTVAGLAVLTTARTSIGGPGLVAGALQSYEVRPVAGVASLVQS